MLRSGPSTACMIECRPQRVKHRSGAAAPADGVVRLSLPAPLDSALALADRRAMLRVRRDVVCAASREADRSNTASRCDETSGERKTEVPASAVVRAFCRAFCAGGSLPREAWRRDGGPVRFAAGRGPREHGVAWRWWAVVAQCRVRVWLVAETADGRRSGVWGAISPEERRGGGEVVGCSRRVGRRAWSRRPATGRDRSHGGCGTIGRYDLR